MWAKKFKWKNEKWKNPNEPFGQDNMFMQFFKNTEIIMEEHSSLWSDQARSENRAQRFKLSEHSHGPLWGQLGLKMNHATHSGLQGSTPSAGEGWGGYTAIKPKTGKAGASLRKMGVASREGHQIMTTRVNAQEMCVGNIITSHAERQPTNALGHRHFSQWYRKCNLHGKENPKQKEYTDMYSWFTLLYSRK